MKKILLVFTLTIFGYALVPLMGQDIQKDFKTSSISIFKNGSAFYVKSGKVPTKNSNYRITENIPQALFGTLWFHSPEGALKHVTSFTDTVTSRKEHRAYSFIEMLNANIGKKMRLHISQEEIFEGVVQEIENPKKASNKEDFIRIPGIANSLVTFKMDDRWMTFSASEIRRIEFLEKPNQLIEDKSIENKPIVQIDFTNANKDQNVEMMYLANGLSWTPNYLIELKSDDKAAITLRAEVTNLQEEIKDTEINFVVGVPNFAYANRLSSLVDFMNSGIVQPTYARNNNFSNSVQSTSIGYAVQEDMRTSFNGAPPPNLEGSVQEDLYFYNLKNVNLKKGGRGQYQVFKNDIDISHIYESNLPQNNANKGYYQSEFLFSPQDQNKVFHSIKVNNDTEYPFTTGSALVIKKDNGTKPISQDLLNYTSIGGHSFVKLTEAPDVKIKYAEKAIDVNDKNKTQKNGNRTTYYDLVTVEGQVKIKNYKNKKIDLNVRRPIIGELLESNVKWLKAERINRTGNFNKITDVCWETSLKAGEELIIKYTYKIYVPD